MDKLEKGPKEIFSPEIQKVSTSIFIEFLCLIIFPTFVQDLLLLEEQEGSVNFKFGVLYTKPGQLTDDEMLSNGKCMIIVQIIKMNKVCKYNLYKQN